MDNETIEDIVSEMRDYAERSDNGGILPDGEDLRIYADRIEAAWKMDRSNAIKTAMMCKCEICKEQGNAAAMREALEAARAALSSYADGGDEDNAETNAVLAEIDAALAAPTRNCDRFADSHDAIEAFENEIDYLKEGGADYGDLAAWLFSRAKGGGE